MRQLIEDLISAMEYHVEQTRPVHMTTVAIQAAKDALKAMPAAPVQDLTDEEKSDLWAWSDDTTPPAAPVQEPARVRECARRLVEHADFRLGGVLSADSKAKDIPSRAVSQVKARHLAALRDALDATPPATQTEWVPVTKELLAAQHPWLYEEMWLAMKDGSLMTGHYQWMQGRYPDRFIVGDCASLWAFEATHVMPMNRPEHPSKLKEQK